MTTDLSRLMNEDAMKSYNVDSMEDRLKFKGGMALYLLYLYNLCHEKICDCDIKMHNKYYLSLIRVQIDEKIDGRGLLRTDDWQWEGIE